jgi:hypothetical protein
LASLDKSWNTHRQAQSPLFQLAGIVAGSSRFAREQTP